MEVTMAKRSKELAPEAEASAAVDPLLDAPPEVKALPELSGAVAQVRTGPSFGERLGRFLRFLVRLFLVIIVGAAIGVGLYFGLPWLYQRYVVPVEQNTSNLVELQSRQEQTEQQLVDLQSKLQMLATVQDQHDQSLTDLDQRLGEVEKEITPHTESLSALEKIQADLQQQNKSASAELERQIDLLKAMELLSRARLFMYQSNFGLARQDVQIARDLLATVQPDAPKPLATELEAVILRLDMTSSNLPDFPVAASDDLDIAWQILLAGLPESTPTPTPTQAGAASPTPEAAVTSSPQNTLTPATTP
jgi:hypothetical protein